MFDDPFLPIELLAMRASVQDSGTYSCQLISSSSDVLATSDFNVVIASKLLYLLCCSAWECKWSTTYLGL